MPPTSAVRRTQQPQSEQNRRQSTRSVRTTTNRPLNYYARPFDSSAGAGDDHQDDTPPGFFPAVQYFTDSITALPKEVVRHFTLMKEVEAKVYGPSQIMTELVGKIMEMPVPPRKNLRPSARNLLSFTANNSATASVNGSVFNGSAPGLPQPPSDISDAASQIAQIDPRIELARRQGFYNLRGIIASMIVNIDEKNVVVAEANRVLEQQLARMDSVVPHVESEISEEARLGSLAHWAYMDNRVKKTANPIVERMQRRDVAATNNLADAAAAMHERDIAATRAEPRREGKKNRAQHVDSEFEDRPATKKPHPSKGRKAAEGAPDVKGLGLTNGSQVPKKRKAERIGGVAMERTVSAAFKAGKGRETPRSTPAAEPVKKRPKAMPVPPLIKKRTAALNSPVPSPKLASSPTIGSFPNPNELGAQRPTSSRMRQNSSTLQYSTLAEKETSRPASAAGSKAGNGTSRSQRGSVAKSKETVEEQGDRMDVDGLAIEADGDKTSSIKQDEGTAGSANEDAGPDATVTRGRTSRIATPLNGHRGEDSSAMIRTKSNGVRSTEGAPSMTHRSSAKNGDSANRHSRSASGTHILKQIASFNRSPHLRRRELASGESNDADSGREEDEEIESPVEEREPANEPRSAPRSTRRSQRARTPDEDETLGQEGEEAGDADADEDDDNAEDPDDPNGDKYCYCGRGSYGTMIACDNEDCKREWFHLGCTGLKAEPDDNVKWFCDECDPNKGRKKSRPISRH